jgi:hypothetical protein
MTNVTYKRKIYLRQHRHQKWHGIMKQIINVAQWLMMSSWRRDVVAALMASGADGDIGVMA